MAGVPFISTGSMNGLATSKISIYLLFTYKFCIFVRTTYCHGNKINTEIE